MSRLKSEISSLRCRCWRWAAPLAAVILALGGSTAARAQGCAMCYNTASAASAGAIQALRSGILVLTFPPLVIFVAIFILVVRRRNRFDDEAAWAVEPGNAEFSFSETLRFVRGAEEGPQPSEGMKSSLPVGAPAEIARLATSTTHSWK